VAASVAVNLCFLGFFKYFNFFVDSADALLKGVGLAGFARHLETFRHPPREHHDLGAMVQEFLHVGGLNTRHVLCGCLAPVPLP